MTNGELIQLIDDKIDEIFLAYQKANNIPSGDIDPLDDLQLEGIKVNLANLIIAMYKANN